MYKVKRNVSGNIARFKVRWMVKGYLQQFNVDFDQTFAMEIKPMAFRVLFVVAVFYDLDIDQMEIKTVFFYDFIDQLIYIKLPKSMDIETNKNILCKLLKALYDFKQFLRLWYE